MAGVTLCSYRRETEGYSVRPVGINWNKVGSLVRIPLFHWRSTKLLYASRVSLGYQRGIFNYSLTRRCTGDDNDGPGIKVLKSDIPVFDLSVALGRVFYKEP
jgi:hypothetical protein